jgi:hypothetical protein
MSRNSVVIEDLSKLKILCPINFNRNGYVLCEGETSYAYGVKVVPYVIIRVNGDEIEYCDALLLPISKELAIKTFRERYYKLYLF